MTTMKTRRMAVGLARTASLARKGPDSVDDGEEPRILLLSFRRKSPLLPQSLLELGPEERVLHATVDDVPWEHRVPGLVAKDIEIRIDTGFRYGGAPLAAVSFGGLDGRRHAPVSERQEGLIEGMPLGLDVEVD